MKIWLFIKTLVSRALLTLLILLYVIPVALMILLPKSWWFEGRVHCWLAYIFYYLSLKLAFVNITWVGKKNLPQSQAIFVANHESSLDIPVLGVLMRTQPHLWLALKELTKMPLLKWVLPRMAVLIDTSTPQKGLRSLIQALNTIKKYKCHVIIFPEGGRFPDTKMHDFYSGFVILAKKSGLPVIPVRTFGLHRVYPPGSFLIYDYPVKVVIGEPFKMGQEETDEAFRDRVHQWFVEQTE